MSKHGFLTPKAIANRIKAKGLQKLRWYCQMCEKQCRDENGFKCHISSESHQRQMLLFADNPHRYMDRFSHEFESNFMDILRRKGEQRVKANNIYQELIADKQHVHMNATKWSSLTGFCYYLQKTGRATVEETEQGLFITYIDKDPKKEARRLAIERRLETAKDEEQRQAEMIEQQIEKAKAIEGHVVQEIEKEKEEGGELKRDPNQRIALSFKPRGASDDSTAAPSESKEGRDVEDPAEAGRLAAALTDAASSSSSSSAAAAAAAASLPRSSAPPLVRKAPPLLRPAKPLDVFKADDGKSKVRAGQKRKASALDQLMAENEERKARDVQNKKARFDYWLMDGIVVKVINKHVGEGKYYKKKGVIVKVHDLFVAEVRMLDSGHVLKIDQADLETVIPAIGNAVLVVNGPYKGETATMLALDEKRFCVSVRLETGASAGKEISRVPLEDVSKLHK